ncbi:hypothetical protein RchiOBHm_Chr2g0103781 [Rosa chinensis]|uniref:Uncharacterized protein n=1 Tax=Rosa chinensis TaxID=74649 RepID=A0A2P6RN09_ROSCH|nr:hypothetical protein RchiOBHm_Chr2g0103781 [Rosa chinensis]
MAAMACYFPHVLYAFHWKQKLVGWAFSWLYTKSGMTLYLKILLTDSCCFKSKFGRPI